MNANGGTRTLVPLRKIAEALNCTVAWRNSDRTVHIFKNGKSIVLAQDNPEVKVYDFEFESKFIYTDEPETIVADVAPVNINGRVLVPLRVIAECLHTNVNHIPETDSITIDKCVDVNCKWNNADGICSWNNYAVTFADMQARNLVEKYNYKPAVVKKTGAVKVTISGNETSVPNFADGMEVEINGQKQVVANNECVFTDIIVGEYEVNLTNLPAGYVVKSVDVAKVTAGTVGEVTAYLVSAPVVEAPAAE